MSGVGEHYRDAIAELINIGVGRAAAELNDLLESAVLLSVPKVDFVDARTFTDRTGMELGDSVSCVSMRFMGEFSGRAALLFPPASAAALVGMLADEEEGPTELDALRSGTLSEVGNLILNGVMGSISNVMTTGLRYTVPGYQEVSPDRLLTSTESSAELLVVTTRFHARELDVEGTVMVLFQAGSLEALLLGIDRMEEVA